MVFKDNSSTRTFRVSLSWISWLGYTLAAAALVTLLTAVLAARYYRLYTHSNPLHLQDLEQRIQDLQAENQRLITRPSATAAVTSPPATALVAAPVGVAALPFATPTGASIPAPEANGNPGNSTAPAFLPLAPHTAQTAASPELFSTLPLLQGTAIPDSSTLPFQVTETRATWMGKTLAVRFNIQYVKTDGGNQSGRIVILAKGPQRIQGYPNGVFNAVRSKGAQATIVPEQGEYFSVSRFRAVEAKFGPFNSHEEVQEVEAFLLTTTGQILFMERIYPNGPRAGTSHATGNGNSAAAPPATTSGIPDASHRKHVDDSGTESTTDGTPPGDGTVPETTDTPTGAGSNSAPTVPENTP